MSRQLYLARPEAVGLWVAYKALAQDSKVVDADGHLLERGHELLDAWERGIGTRGIVTGGEASVERLLHGFDVALDPLLTRKDARCRPQSTWTFAHEHFHPSKVTRPESVVLRRILRGDPRRAELIDVVESHWPRETDLLALTEREVLEAICETNDALGECATAALRFEALSALLTTSFRAILFVGGRRPDGCVTVDALIGDDEIGETFSAAPGRIERSLRDLAPHMETADRRARAGDTLDWVGQGALESPRSLFRALLERHSQTQARKPPDGKRTWLEQSDDAVYVRPRYTESSPPDLGARVHTYRTHPIRSCLWDLWGRVR